MSPIMSRDPVTSITCPHVCKKGSRVSTSRQGSFRSPSRYRKHLEVYCAAFAQFCSPQYSQSGFCQSHVTFELIFNTTVKVTILKVTVIKWRIEMIRFWDLKIKRKDREKKSQRE